VPTRSGRQGDLTESTFLVFEGCSDLYLAEDKHWGADLDIIRGVVNGYGDVRLLDAGCGPGWHLVNVGYLCPQFSRRVGLDYSERMLAVAERFIAQAGMLAEINLVLGDILEMPFKDAEFDVVLCLANTLGNLPGHAFEESTQVRRKALQELRRVLRGGGALVLSVYNADRLAEQERYGRVFILDPHASQMETNDLVIRFYDPNDEDTDGTPYYSHWFTADEVRSLVADSGFRVLDSEERKSRIVLVARPS